MFLWIKKLKSSRKTLKKTQVLVAYNNNVSSMEAMNALPTSIDNYYLR